MEAPRANPCSGTENLQSDAIFTTIGEQVKLKPDEAKKVNAVFLYNITVDGKPKSEWSKYNFGNLMNKSTKSDKIQKIKKRDYHDDRNNLKVTSIFSSFPDSSRSEERRSAQRET